MNTTNKKQDPWAVAKERNIAVRFVDLPGLWGLHAGNRVIYLQKSVTAREQRSVLAHELGHEARGDVHIPRHLAPKAEASCDVYAAEMLIDPEELLRLAHLYPDNPGQVAYELDVADWVLDAYLRAHPISIDSEDLVA